MPDPQTWSLGVNLGVFAAAAAVIAVAGTLMARTADRLADATGLGEAFFGAVFLGGSTSLPGIVTSVTAAHRGHAELAVSNALGGIAAQTAFLAIADMAYRRANLEHSAASLPNMMQAVLCTTLLAIPLVVTAMPQVTFLGAHPGSYLLIAAYVFGTRLVQQAHRRPMWGPMQTPETAEDRPDAPRLPLRGQLRLWAGFLPLAGITGAAGYAVGLTGIAISDKTGLSETAVGSLLTAISTSLPELVTAVAAVRAGALTLAVGDIVGGNTFDVLFVAFSDLAYREGSIYHALGGREVFVIGITVLLTNVLLLGLLRREKHGPGGIGFESVLILAIYAGAVVLFLS